MRVCALVLASGACVSLSCDFCTVRLALLVSLILAASSFAVLMCAPRDMRGKTVSMLCVNRSSSGIWAVPGRAFVVFISYGKHKVREERR
jgi:hypothetical protein